MEAACPWGGRREAFRRPGTALPVGIAFPRDGRVVAKGAGKAEKSWKKFKKGLAMGWNLW